MKAHLTDEEFVRAGLAVVFNDVEQFKVAEILGINQGRIGEAAKAMRWYAANRKLAYEIATGQVITAEAEPGPPSLKVVGGD